MSQITTISARIAAEVQNAIDQGTVRASARLDASLVMQSGSGSEQANKVFSDQRTISASSNETLDLTSLTDPLGAAISFTAVKAILIVADEDNTNDVVVGDATNPFLGPLGGTNPTETLKPGASLMWLNPDSGWSVSNGVNDGLKVANSSSGSSVVYDIIVIGH